MEFSDDALKNTRQLLQYRLLLAIRYSNNISIIYVMP